MSQSNPAPWPSPRYSWYVVFVLLVAYTLAFVDRVVLSLLVDPIRRDLDITDTQMSLLHGFAFAIFYSLLGVPIASLSDRRDRRRIIAAGIAVWSAMTVACGLARNFWQLFAARVGVGAGEAALSPAAYSMLADSFPPERLGRAIGVYSTAIYGGAGLALIFGGTVATLLARAGAIELPLIGTIHPWQMTFLAVGLPGLLVAGWVYSLREPPRRATAAQAMASATRTLAAQFRAHARAYACHILGFTMLAVAFNAAVAWAPSHFMRSFAWSPARAAFWLGTVMMVFGSAGIVTGGMLADRWRSAGREDAALRVGITSGLGLLPFAMLAPLVDDAALAVVFYAPFMFFSALAFGAAVTGLQLITPAGLRARVSAIFLLTVNLIGLGAGPLVTALFTDHVFRSDLRVGDSLAVVGASSALLGAGLLYFGLPAFRSAQRGA